MRLSSGDFFPSKTRPKKWGSESNRPSVTKNLSSLLNFEPHLSLQIKQGPRYSQNQDVNEFIKNMCGCMVKERT